MIGQYLADQFDAELDDEEVHGVLKHHGAEALEEAGDALLLEDGGEAVSDPLVPGEDGRHLNAAVQVVDDAPRALEVESVQHSLQGGAVRAAAWAWYWERPGRLPSWGSRDTAPWGNMMSAADTCDDNTHCEPLIFPVGRLEDLEPGGLHQGGDGVVSDRVDNLDQ